MPPLSVLEYRGTSSRNDLNTANIGAYTRGQSENLANRTRLAVMSSVLKQNAVVRDIIGRESLITRREGQLRQLDDQLSQYYGEFGSVLNDRALNFLNEMSKIQVPTVTSILAGFENARASRADMEKKRVDDMERLMTMDANLQRERMALRREQIEAEQMVGQAQLKAMDELYGGQSAVNKEAFTALAHSGTWDANPEGRVIHGPHEKVEVLQDRTGNTRGERAQLRSFLKEGDTGTATTPSNPVAKSGWKPGGAYVMNEYFGNGQVDNAQENLLDALSNVNRQIGVWKSKAGDSASNMTDRDVVKNFAEDADIALLGKVLTTMRGNIANNPDLRRHFLEGMGGNAGGQADRFLSGIDFTTRDGVIEGLGIVFDKLLPHSRKVRNINAGTAAAKEGEKTGTTPEVKVEGSLPGIPENIRQQQKQPENNKAQQTGAATVVEDADVAYSGTGMTTIGGYDQSTAVGTPRQSLLGSTIPENKANVFLQAVDDAEEERRRSFAETDLTGQEREAIISADARSPIDPTRLAASGTKGAPVDYQPEPTTTQQPVSQESMNAFNEQMGGILGERAAEFARGGRLQGTKPEALVWTPDYQPPEPEGLVWTPDYQPPEPIPIDSTPVVRSASRSSTVQPIQPVQPSYSDTGELHPTYPSTEDSFVTREWNASKARQNVMRAADEYLRGLPEPADNGQNLRQEAIDALKLNTNAYTNRRDHLGDEEFVRSALASGYAPRDIGNILQMDFPQGYDRMAYLSRAARPVRQSTYGQSRETEFWETQPEWNFSQSNTQMDVQTGVQDEVKTETSSEGGTEVQSDTQMGEIPALTADPNMKRGTELKRGTDYGTRYRSLSDGAQVSLPEEQPQATNTARIEAQLNADRVPPTRIDTAPLQVERPWYDPNVSSTYQIGMDTADIQAPVRVAAGRLPGDNRIVRLTDANGNFYDVPASMLGTQPRRQRHWTVLNDEDARLREAGGINLDRVNALFDSMVGGMTAPSVYQPTQGTVPNTPYRLWDAGQLPMRIFDARDPASRSGEKPSNPVLDQINPRTSSVGQAVYDAIIAQGGTEEEATLAGVQAMISVDPGSERILTASAYDNAMADIPAADKVYMTNAGLQRQAQGDGRSAHGFRLSPVTGAHQNIDVYQFSGGQSGWDGLHSLTKDRMNRFAEIAGQYGVRVPLVTSFRDQKFQADLYQKNVVDRQRRGQRAIRTAKPGWSNHQGGLAFDTDVTILGKEIMANPQLREYAIQKYGSRYGRNNAYFGVIDEWLNQAGLHRPLANKNDPSHVEPIQDNEYYSRVNHARYMADKGRWNGAAAYEIGQSAPPKMTQTQVKQAQARTTGQKPLNKGMSVNNPFNLRTIEYVRPGEVKNTRRDFQGFGAFKDLMSGVTAGVHSVIARNIVGRNTDTIRKFVNTYLGVDPRTGTNATNDNPEQYMRNLEQATGLRRDDPIDITDEQLMLNLLGMVAQTETGSRNYIGVDNLRTAYRKVMSDIGRRINSAQRGQGRRTTPVTREQLRRDTRTIPM